MKKIILILFIFDFFIFPLFSVEVHASNDYQSYVEIIMTTGKLLKDFTDEEIDEFIQDSKGLYFFYIDVIPINSNIQASYISNTLFSVENRSATSVQYDVDISLETNNKVTFQTSGSLSSSSGGTMNKIKKETSAKGNIEYSNTTTVSKKEKKTMRIVVEENSRAIIYLTGEMSITNGVAVVYRFFTKIYTGGYEFVTLKSQYSRIEKVSIK
ncbi:MAG: hypothetical protein ACI35S_08900 [Anaeroplasma sp.]